MRRLHVRNAAKIIILSLAALCLAVCLGACANGGDSGASPDEQGNLEKAEASAVDGDAGDGEGDSSFASAPEDASQAASDAPEPESPNVDALKAILGDEVASKLIALAQVDADAAWIAAHPEAYEPFGGLQAKLLKLAADDPQAIPFVRDYPDKYPADAPDPDAPAMNEGSPSTQVPDTGVPHYYQWDKRWGYTQYSADGFGLAGCGPTSMAMVYQGLTGKDDLSPYDMGKLATDSGFVVYDQGTSSEFFTETATELGLGWWYVNIDADSIREVLLDNCLIIANVGPGYFSEVGHFFVLAGLSEDGRVILNDPYSVTRSMQLWDAEFIASQSIVLYGYGYIK